MKRILFFIFGAMLVFQSCKDGIEQPKEKIAVSIEDAELSLRAVPDCDVIPKLCPKPWLWEIQKPTTDPGPTGPSGPGGPSIGSSSRIVVVDDGIEHHIEPLDHLEGSRQFSVRTNDMTYVISDTENPYVQKYQTEEIEVPHCISTILTMDFESLTSGRTTEGDVAEHFDGRPVSTESSGRIVVGDFETADDDCPPATLVITVYQWCSWRKAATISSWKRNMAPGFASGGIEADILDKAITDAVNACEEDTETCFDCIDSRCVLDKLDRSDLGEDFKNEIKFNYLILLLDLDSDQKKFLEDNEEYLDNLLGKYGLRSSEIGCDLGQCGSQAAAKAHLELLEADIEVGEEERMKLCNHYLDTYNAEPNDWYFCARNNFSLDYNMLLVSDNDDHLNTDFADSDLGDFLSNECVLDHLVNLGPDDVMDRAAVDKIVEWFLDSNPSMKSQTDAFLAKYSSEMEEAQEHLNRHVLMMAADSDYQEFVAASAGGLGAGFGGAIWGIIAELVGDKLVDLAFRFVPGFGNADEVRDAIKAAKNGDWLEFTMEVGKIIGKNTPLGKWWQLLEGTVEMRELYRRIDKIQDAIGGFSEAVIEQMWDIARKYGPNSRLNSSLLKSVAKGVKNGVAKIDDVLEAIDNWDKLDVQTLTHILHGDGKGLHHISGLIKDPNKVVTRYVKYENSGGIYSALVDGKFSTFFPDDLSEIDVTRLIKEVYETGEDQFQGSKLFRQKIVNGFPLRVNIKSNGKIETAFPVKP